MDAAYLLPIVGLVLWLLPIVRDPAMTEEQETAGGFIYVFGIWILLIIFAFVLARALRSDDEGGSEGRNEREPDGEPVDPRCAERGTAGGR